MNHYCFNLYTPTTPPPPQPHPPPPPTIPTPPSHSSSMIFMSCMWQHPMTYDEINVSDHFWTNKCFNSAGICLMQTCSRLFKLITIYIYIEIDIYRHIYMWWHPPIISFWWFSCVCLSVQGSQWAGLRQRRCGPQASYIWPPQPYQSASRFPHTQAGCWLE